MLSIRQLLNIHYPSIVGNNDICAMTRQHLWTDKINQDKLRFTGHILRLPEGTPARQALQIALKPVTRPRGRQKTTWMQSTNTLLQSVGLDNLGTNKLQESADDKKTWKQKTYEVLHGRRALDSALLLLLLLSTPLHQRAASRVQHPKSCGSQQSLPPGGKERLHFVGIRPEVQARKGGW